MPNPNRTEMVTALIVEPAGHKRNHFFCLEEAIKWNDPFHWNRTLTAYEAGRTANAFYQFELLNAIEVVSLPHPLGESTTEAA